MGDLQMQEAADESSTGEQPLFSEAENEILDLYDQVKNLELEIALAKSRTRLAGKQMKYLACRFTTTDGMQMRALRKLDVEEMLRARMTPLR